MRRVGIIAVLSMLLMAFSASVALAQVANPHFLPQTGTPSCTISGSGASKTVVCTGTLAGLGNEDVLITTTVSGFAVYQCQNQGGNIAPGQNKVLVGPSVTPTLISAGEIRNGRLTFTTNANTLSAPTTVTAAQAGCPNANWTGVNPTVTVTSVTLTVEQPVGNLILTCTKSSSTGLSSFKFAASECTFT